MTWRSTTVLLLGCALLGGPERAIAQGGEAGSRLPSVELPAPLDRVLRDYEAAWGRSDEHALAELFTEDGFLLSGRSRHLRGRPAIRERYANADGVLVLRAVAFEVSDALAYIVGAYRYDEGEDDRGKFVLVLERIDGPWYIAVDMDGSSGG